MACQDIEGLVEPYNGAVKRWHAKARRVWWNPTVEHAQARRVWWNPTVEHANGTLMIHNL